MNWYDYGARYYAAWIGRWTATDPMAGERTWVNPYNYVQNNPINRTDPTGALDDDTLDNTGPNAKGDNDLNAENNNFIFDDVEAEKWHMEKITPVYKRHRKTGEIKMRKGKPVLDRRSNYDANYAALVEKINQQSDLEVRVKNSPPPPEIAKDAHGTVVAGADNAVGKEKNHLIIFYSEPNETHGGGWEHVLAEEIFHVGQTIESKEWKDSRSAPEFNTTMEVQAKEFAASQGGSYSTYYTSGGWQIPTEMGIMGNSDKYNRNRINKVEYLSGKTDTIIWQRTGDSENPIRTKVIDHGRYY